MTDSGGFRVMSLGPLRQLSEDGVTFKSLQKHHRPPNVPPKGIFLMPRSLWHSTSALHSRPLNRWQPGRWNCQCAGPSGLGRPLGVLAMANLVLFKDRFADLRAESVAALTDIGFEGYAVGGRRLVRGKKLCLKRLR